MRSGKFSKTLITIIPLNTGKHATIPQQTIKILLIFTLQLNDQSHILYLMDILFRILSKNQSEMVWTNLSVSLLDFLSFYVIQMNQYCFYKSHRSCIFIPAQVVKILKEFKRIKTFYLAHSNWVAIRKLFYWGFWQPTELEIQLVITKKIHTGLENSARLALESASKSWND